MSEEVTFIFGLGSRYSYLAASQVRRLEALARGSFRWVPIASPRLIEMAHVGATPFERPEGQYQAGYRGADVARWARHYGIAYHEPRLGGLEAEDPALACWCCEDEKARRLLAEGIFKAVFEEGAALTGADLARLATAIGVVGTSAVGWPALPDAIARHDAAINEAHARGAFGVPSFFVGDEMFFGNDRLVLLGDRLTGRSA